jgi:hypothetical protein
VYALPLEAFQFRDLDSGRTFYMDKRFWIKDVDSGKVYVLEPGGGEAGDNRPGATSPDGGGGVRVSDLLSGQAMSLEEFEDALGFFKASILGVIIHNAQPAAQAPAWRLMRARAFWTPPLAGSTASRTPFFPPSAGPSPAAAHPAALAPGRGRLRATDSPAQHGHTLPR